MISVAVVAVSIGLFVPVYQQKRVAIGSIFVSLLCLFIYGFVIELGDAEDRARLEYEMFVLQDPPVDCGANAVHSDQLQWWRRLGLIVYDTRKRDCKDYVERMVRHVQPMSVFIDYVCGLGVVVVDRSGMALHRLVAHHDFYMQILIVVLIAYVMFSCFQAYLTSPRSYSVVTDPLNYSKRIELEA